jgi:UDP-N-acetylglucosamine--N-acetylmuramyl-(pentapeptide) pyrophosphoryl-undecaprenol N-acetylglucosamine transferase
MEKIYIAAGGTGGHINAALSLGDEFKSSYVVKFISGTRYLDYQLFADYNCLHINSKPLRTKNPIKFILNTLFNIKVFISIFFKYLLNRPAFIVGAGGYVCGPALLAGKIIGIPIFIIEQNAVVGMTNRILSRFANMIFTNFKITKGLQASTKIIQTGNPVRSQIKPSENIILETVNILIFGGSLGATQINKAIEIYVGLDQIKKLNIIHQVGKNNINPSVFIGNNIDYTQLEYINDMDEKYKWCNIIIARSGASTVSELRVVKRPTLLIPFPLATDNHQYLNAKELKEEDGFYVEIINHKLIGESLANEIAVGIKKIITDNKYYQKKIPNENASSQIRKEIETYVRN